MRIFALIFALLCGIFVLAQPASAAVEARIHLTSQRMVVVIDGIKTGEYVVSTGKRGYRTPVGDFKPTRMHKKYYSKKYHNSPMPNSIFFNGGIAVHGTYEVARLGKPASHGCVRMHPRDAAALFGLVQSHGMTNSRIVVTN
ncbi:MAG: L,D-transpeptidase [Siculibacillus sp.]|nr:L,D-transpeptidase [Siculibacillus sp.]